MKRSHQLMIGSLAALVLSACSSDPSSRRQAEDKFEYANSQLTQGWEIPSTASRQYYRQYQIPQGDFQGAIGEAVDIRPPQQILELIPGARYMATEVGVIVWPASPQEADNLWASINTMIDKRGIQLRQNTPTTIETDWIDLTAEDEPNPIASRYMIERVNQGSRLGIMVSLSEFKENGEVVPLTPEISDRYSRNMINYITSQYDDQRRAEARKQAAANVKFVQLGMANDRSGLPVIVARAPYTVMWEKMTSILPSLGFEIEGRNESQGQIETTYKRPTDDFYDQLAIEPVTLDNQDYTLLLGDLNNRTSINVTDKDGKPVDEDALESLLPALDALLNESGNDPYSL